MDKDIISIIVKPEGGAWKYEAHIGDWYTIGNDSTRMGAWNRASQAAELEMNRRVMRNIA